MGLNYIELIRFFFPFFFPKDEAEFTAASGLGEMYLLISKEKKKLAVISFQFYYL